jgi:hypothetical protein
MSIAELEAVVGKRAGQLQSHLPRRNFLVGLRQRRRAKGENGEDR